MKKKYIIGVLAGSLTLVGCSAGQTVIREVPQTTQAPVETQPSVNKYEAYMDHVLSNSGQANTTSTADLIEFADIVCNALDRGGDLGEIVNIFNQNSTGFSDDQMYAAILTGAVKYVCPQHESTMRAYLNGI